ncbi:MAG TPA: hypothetical protein DCO77_09580 [Nitrospiraceae bacterium]|nr:hypothetical protein [Nitrospiraceae bacterium]
MTNKHSGAPVTIPSAILALHHRIGAVLELEEIGRILVDEPVYLERYDGYAILLGEGNEMGILAQRDAHLMIGEAGSLSDVPAVQSCRETKTTVHAADHLHRATPENPDGSSLQSMICSPVLVHDTVRGVICLVSSDGDALHKGDLQFAELLTQELSMAVLRADQYAWVKALTSRDAGTGCYNRGQFKEDINASLSSSLRYGRPLSLLMVTADDSGRRADTPVHGDYGVLIKNVADALCNSIRLCDRLYRYSEHQLVLLLPETDREQAHRAATRVKQLVDGRLADAAEGAGGKPPSIHIGVANLPVDGGSEETLVHAAEAALRKAPQSGGIGTVDSA